MKKSKSKINSYLIRYKAKSGGYTVLGVFHFNNIDEAIEQANLMFKEINPTTFNPKSVSVKKVS